MSEVTRKLATVRKIAAVDPIEGADNIVCATVDGWKLVTQKSNNFQPGDLVVYFEIDSFLPVNETFEWLRASSYKKMGDEEGFRLKTIKLRGQVSQGLILPLIAFPYELIGATHFDGQDLTEILGIKKYEKPISPELAGKIRGNFPTWLVKTDQERVQNIFKYIQGRDREYEATLKLDGSSMTVYSKSGYVGVCSRNLDLEDTDNTFWKVARSTGLIDALEKAKADIAVQGELMGPGVQGNRENLKEHKFFVFDVYIIENGQYARPKNRAAILHVLSSLGAKIDEAPVVGVINTSDFVSVDDFLTYAERPSLTHPTAEGVVFKSLEDPRDSFKVISNRFLLKEKD